MASHESDDSQHTDGTGHSSDHEVDAHKTTEIFVVSQVGLDEPFIRFHINTEQRPDTLLESQGDHTTSYTLLIQALLASANTQLRGAIESIKQMAETVLEEDGLKAFHEIKEPVIHTHEERKAVLHALKATTSLRDIAPRIDKELKYAKMTILSQYLAELSVCLLEGMQQHELATVYSKGRLGKDPKEGVKAKTAARALVALNMIYRFAGLEEKDIDTERVDNILHALSPRKATLSSDIEEQHVLRYGLSALKGETGKGIGEDKAADRLCREIERVKSEPKKIKALFEALGNEFKQKEDTIAAFIGDLYDYRYKLAFNLQQAFPFSPIKTREEAESAAKYWERKIEDTFFDKKHTYILPDYKKIINGDINAIIIRKDISNLAETIRRHFIIISSAFPELVKQTNFQNIKNAFIQNVVLGAQGWNEYANESIPLSLDKINEKLNELKQDEAAPAPNQPGSSSRLT